MEAGKWTKTVSFWSRRKLWITVSWWAYILEVREILACGGRYLVKIQNSELLFTCLKVPLISMVKNLQHPAFQDGIGITFFLIQTGNGIVHYCSLS
jgi:hypothetical protein